MNSIPKLIHLTCKKYSDIPKYSVFMTQLLKLHPGWQIKFYDDFEAREIIKANFYDLLWLYDAYPTNIQRVDIFRIVIVYLYGGFYLDMDMYCLKKLDDLCALNLVLGVEKNLSEEEGTALKLPYTAIIANYMFGSKPGHLFWIDLIESAIAVADRPVVWEDDVLNSTGPGLLSATYHLLKRNYTEIVVLDNIDRKCMKGWCKGFSCHFGDFAAHFHWGSWRWQYGGKIPRVPDSLPNKFYNKKRILNLSKKMMMLKRKLKTIKS